MDYDDIFSPQFNHDASKPLHLREPVVKGNIDDGLINAVIAAAVWTEGQRPGVWQKMIAAMYHGAARTEKGTVNAFLFQAMVDRLLEEFQALEDK